MLLGDTCLAPTVDGLAFYQPEAFQFVAAASGTSATAYLYIRDLGNTSAVEIGLYTDASGAPGTLLGRATIQAPAAFEWNSVALPGIAITSGTAYWLAIDSLGGGFQYIGYYDTYPAGTPALVYADQQYTDLPGSFSASGDPRAGGPISAYVTQ